MTKKNLMAIGYGLGALSFAAVGAMLGDQSTLLAADVGTISNTVRQNFGGIVDLISGGSYIIGLASGIQAALKFKAHNENPQQVKLSQPVVYLAVCGALLALPTFITTGSETLFGNGSGNTTRIDGNGLGR